MAFLPPWLRRRRKFAARRFTSDREACEFGGDPLERANNWMQHVLGRDFEGGPLQRAIIVVEVGEPPLTQVVYTAHSVDATGVEIRGLLEEALRGQAEIATRANRNLDLNQFVSSLLPLLGEQIEDRIFSKAQETVAALGKVLEDEEAIERQGAAGLIERLGELNITPENLRGVAPDGQYPVLGKGLAELADRMEAAFEEVR